MTAIRATTKSEQPNGRRVVETFIVADTDPAVLPVNGDGIKGLQACDVFAPFSLLYVTDGAKVYVTNEQGEFVAQ